MGESTYSNMAIIRITDLTLRAIIGTNAWERTTKQKVVINVTLEYNSAKASKTDNIQYAVDYKIITKKIIDRVTRSRFFLLERLANMVLKTVMENKVVRTASVRIDKPRALRFAKSVSVELSAKH